MVHSCIIGATGGVGTPIAMALRKLGPVVELNSKNCNLNDEQGIPKFSDTNCDLFVNAAGKASGLKSYEKDEALLSEKYLENLSDLIDQLQPKVIINISSAFISNPKNHTKDCAYYSYVKTKEKIEALIAEKNVDTIVHLRCTSIVSQYENYADSGHAIASIYRNYLKADDKVSIWSHPEDWREYLDTDDLAALIPTCLTLEGKHTINLGSGHKSYMADIVSSFNQALNFKGGVEFTQPKKPTPLVDTVGIPAILAKAGMVPTPMKASIDKCIRRWKNA